MGGRFGETRERKGCLESPERNSDSNPRAHPFWGLTDGTPVLRGIQGPEAETHRLRQTKQSES